MMGLSPRPKPMKMGYVTDNDIVIDNRKITDEIAWLTENLYNSTSISKFSMESLNAANQIANLTKYERVNNTLIIGDYNYTVLLDSIIFLEYNYEGGLTDHGIHKPHCVIVHINGYLPQGIKIPFVTKDYAKTCMKTISRWVSEQNENKILET